MNHVEEANFFEFFWKYSVESNHNPPYIARKTVDIAEACIIFWDQFLFNELSYDLRVCNTIYLSFQVCCTVVEYIQGHMAYEYHCNVCYLLLSDVISNAESEICFYFYFWGFCPISLYRCKWLLSSHPWMLAITLYSWWN